MQICSSDLYDTIFFLISADSCEKARRANGIKVRKRAEHLTYFTTACSLLRSYLNCLRSGWHFRTAVLAFEVSCAITGTGYNSCYSVTTFFHMKSAIEWYQTWPVSKTSIFEDVVVAQAWPRATSSSMKNCQKIDISRIGRYWCCSMELFELELNRTVLMQASDAQIRASNSAGNVNR